MEAFSISTTWARSASSMGRKGIKTPQPQRIQRSQRKASLISQKFHLCVLRALCGSILFFFINGGDTNIKGLELLKGRPLPRLPLPVGDARDAHSLGLVHGVE